MVTFPQVDFKTFPLSMEMARMFIENGATQFRHPSRLSNHYPDILLKEIISRNNQELYFNTRGQLMGPCAAIPCLSTGFIVTNTHEDFKNAPLHESHFFPHGETGLGWSGAPVKYPEDRAFITEPWQTLPKYDHLEAHEIPVGVPIFYPSTFSVWRGTKHGFFPFKRYMKKDDIRKGKLREESDMPDWASRATMIVHNIRVDCDQNITNEDARKCGYDAKHLQDQGHKHIKTAKDAYVWDFCRRHGLDVWSSNPVMIILDFGIHYPKWNEMGWR